MKTGEIGINVSGYYETTVEAKTKEEAIRLACEESFEDDLEYETDYVREIFPDEL